MIRLTFSVSASSFAANMAMRQNAINYSHRYLQASQTVLQSFYVDDDLTGANSVEEAIQLRADLQTLFNLGGFQLRKWKSNEQDVLSTIPQDLIDWKTTQEMKYGDDYTKIPRVQWNAASDCFRPIISLPEIKIP